MSQTAKTFQKKTPWVLTRVKRHRVKSHRSHKSSFWTNNPRFTSTGVPVLLCTFRTFDAMRMNEVVLKTQVLSTACEISHIFHPSTFSCALLVTKGHKGTQRHKVHLTWVLGRNKFLWRFSLLWLLCHLTLLGLLCHLTLLALLCHLTLTWVPGF